MKKPENKKNAPIRVVVFIIFVLINYSITNAQTSCYDIDFETGTLNGWTTSGNVVLTSVGTDNYGSFPLSAPGGAYSVKVGNNTSSTPSSISKSFVVNNSNPVLTYKYAMDILNYPHSAADAARIVFDIYDNANNPIGCGHYEAFFSTSGGLTGFLISDKPGESNSGGECCYNISYKPWTALSVDLSAYIGQSVTLKATCKWCVYNVDWAYAYFDFGCSSFQIQQDSTCNRYGALLLAPADFVTYSWTGPGIVSGQTKDSAYVNQPGVYTVNMTTATGCTISKNINVNYVPPVATAVISRDTSICLGQTIPLTASGGVTYQWWNRTETTAVINVSPTTVTSYTVEITDARGCTDTATTKVSLFPLPIADFSSTDVCLNRTMTFNDSSKVTGATINSWSWNFGDNSSLNTSQNTGYKYPTPGTYPVSLIVTTNNGCKDTITKNVTVHPPPIPEFHTANVCMADSVHFSNQSTILATDTIHSFTWDFGDNSPHNNNINISHLYAAPSSYLIKLTAVSNFGCSDSITKPVVVNPKPTVAFTGLDTIGCELLCVSLQDGSSILSGYNNKWVWNVGDGSALGTTSTYEHCYKNDSVFSPLYFNVSLTVTSDSGCVSSLTKNNFVTVYPLPNANFTVTPTTTTIINPIISFSNLTTGANFWNWSFGDSDTASTFSPSPHTYADSGKYTITLIVSTLYHCLDTAYETVIIEPDFAFFIPNAFTPNGDGVNDTFIGKGVYIKKFEMTIFDRWGDLIYQTDDINKPWDGKANHGSDAAQIDVYVWKVHLTDVFDKPHDYIGRVSLVR